ncbi:DNA primase family protein [Corynebacterium casei]|uniref:DNA primase family protein n=1 Tax=Corynebacterium casei TaxID=160386 RepID=UPI003FD5CE38
MKLSPREQARLDGIPEDQLHYYPDGPEWSEDELATVSPIKRTKVQSPPPAQINRLNGNIEQAKRGDSPSYPPPSRPYDVANQSMSEMFINQNGLKTLVYWRGDFWLYTGTHFRLIKDDLEVKQKLWQRLNAAEFEGKEGELVPWSPTTAKIKGLMEPLQILSLLDADQQSPSWLLDSEAHGLDAAHVVSAHNGLIDLQSRRLHPHTPGLFTTWSLPFDYDPHATCPRWDSFLQEVFAHDPKGSDLLQEFAGLLISGRTDLQKALLVVGPKRGGKGTISRIMQSLVGAANCVSPTLGTLGGEFGLEGLIGKPLAVIEDARGDERMSTTVERLLNIIGEDTVAVNRKGIEFWYGKLPTRFMIFSNEMPRFFDSSGAITSRFMYVRLQQSFAANPDPNLKDKLTAELPGIFNWALRGLDRLNQNDGVFTRPDTMDEMQDLMTDMASPLTRFFEEEYEITGDPKDILDVSTVMSEFKPWWEEQGMKPINRETFIQRATAANPYLQFKNSLIDGKKKRRFYGIRPRPPSFSTSNPLGTGSIGSSS